MNLEMLTGPYGRWMMYSHSARGKRRTLRRFRGSLEAWRFKDPQAYDKALAEIRGLTLKPGMALELPTNAERRQLKAAMRAQQFAKDLVNSVTEKSST